MRGPEFLKKKFNKPHTSKEVEKAVKRKEKQTGERIHDAEEKIQTYLDRFKEITSRTDPKHQEQGIRALKQVLHQLFVMEYKDVPESYFDLQKRSPEKQDTETLILPKNYNKSLQKQSSMTNETV